MTQPGSEAAYTKNRYLRVGTRDPNRDWGYRVRLSVGGTGEDLTRRKKGPELKKVLYLRSYLKKGSNREIWIGKLTL